MALMTLMDYLINFLHKGEYFIGIFPDSLNDFDSVDHDIFCKSYLVMVFVTINCLGFEAISRTGISS